MNTARGLLISVILIGLNLNTYCQDYNDLTWYFGTTGNGYRFNLSDRTPELLNENVGLGTGGSAVAVNPNTGEVMFYTDGANVYDANHQFMPSGTGLNGNTSSSSPVVISQVPGEPDQYYIFTNSATPASPGEITFSIVDMSEFGNALFPLPPSGDVISKNQAINAILSNVAQGMIVIPNANCDGFWLIAQESGTDSYHVLEINETGLTNITTYGGVGLPIEAASMAYHPGTNRLAVAPENTENNVVILDVDPATGALSLNTSVLNSGRNTTANEAIYDVEWSLTGSKLYISRIGETGQPADLVQYDVNDPSVTLTNILPTSIHRSYGLKAAPDSSIYHLFQQSNNGSFIVGKISDTDSVASEVIYEISPFGVPEYNGKNFSVSLPLYEPQFDLNFDISGTCSNVPSIFTAEMNPTPDSVIWNFGDGSGSREFSPVYTYEDGGPQNVSLLAFKNGKPDTLTRTVNITEFELQIDMAQDTVACKCELPVNSSLPECAGSTEFFSVTADISGGTPTSVVWSNGQTGTTLNPDSAGYYYVVATDATGCSAYAGVTVREYGEIDQRANIWYFGQNAGIDFNDQPPSALDDSQMDAPEGCSVISDRNGQAIFYTDGDQVYDKEHNNITPPGGLGGDPGASQSALIVPFPNDETLYYIFTTQEIYGQGTYELDYSIFDLKENNGNGAIIANNITLFTRSTERISGINNWIVAHEYGNKTFRAYPITNAGIGVPVLSEIGTKHSFSNNSMGQGYMKFSQTGKLAVAVSDEGNFNYVDLFDFDINSGELSNYQQLDLEEASGNVYGVEFSPGGNKLFSTIIGPPNYVIEHFIDSIGVAYFKQKIETTEDVGAIQLSPTGQIFAAIQGSNSLGAILANEDTTQLSSFIPGGIQLAGGTSSNLGLPSFIQNIASPLRSPGISVAGLCFGDTTQFSATGTDIIDQYTWFFGDNTSEIGQNVSHFYTSPGEYTVAVQITNRCGLDTTLTRNIVISEIPEDPILPPTEQLCDGSVQLSAADPTDPQFTDYQYAWSTGDTTNVITVDRQAIVSVVISNSAGCTSSGQTAVIDNRPFIDIGPDQTVCENQVVLDLDAGNTGANYQWTINGNSSGTTQTQAVDTSTPGIYDYEVAVTDPITNCTITEIKTITVVEIPNFTVTTTNSPGCNNNDGTIEIDITTVGSYSYFLNGPDFRNNINQFGPLTITENNLPVGTYFVSIQDEVSNCLVTQSVNILDEGSTMVINTPVSNPGCTEISVNVDINDGTYDGSSGFNYTLTNLDNTDQTTGFSATEPFDTDEVIPGNYTLLIEDIASTCTEQIGPFTITESQQANLTLQRPDECEEMLTATTNASDPVFVWLGPNGFTGSGSSITAPETGDYTVTVSDNSNAFCPATRNLFVTVSPFDPVITQTGDVCSGEATLNVEPATGNYSYNWSGPQNGGSTLTVTPATSGTYQVRVTNRDTGCSKLSNVLDITVTNPVEVLLNSSLACDDGNPFILTADASPGVNFEWFKDNSLLPNENGSSISRLDGGRYRVVVENNGCTDEASLNITLAPFSEPDLPNRVSICDDPDNPNPETSQVEFDAGSIFVDFVWKFNNSEVGYDRQYIALESGTYTVDLINAYGCPAADTVEVVTECDPIIDAPNAFSPNGNSQNEEFFIFETFVSDEFDIKMYSEWGELIFHSTNKSFKWNGGYQNDLGKPLPGGTYVYVIKYKSSYQPERGTLEKRGGVVLLR